MPLSRLIRTLTVGLLVIASAMPVAAITLESLPEATQEDIAKLCLPVQFKEGAAAYRNCVQSELDIRSETTEKSNELTNLSFDDRYAVQQACAKAGAESSDSYQTCVKEQISALQRIDAPKLDNFSEDELDAIQQACFDAQSRLGAAAFRECLNTEVKSLNDIPKVNLSSLTALEKNALQLRCSAIASTAAAYRLCLSDEHLLITGKSPVFEQNQDTETTAKTTSTDIQADSVSSKNASAQAKNAPAQAAKPAAKPATKPVVAKTEEKPVAKKPEVSIATLEAPKPASSNNNTTSASQAGRVVAALPRNIAPQRANAESDSATERATDPTPDAVSSNEALLSSNDARVISKPGLATELPAADDNLQSTQTSVVEDIAADTPAIQDSAKPTAPQANGSPIAEKAMAVWQGFLQKLGTLNSTGWLVLAGILVMPAILLGLFSIIRRSKKSAYKAMPHPHLSENLDPELQSRKRRQEQEAAELFGSNDDIGQRSEALTDNHAETRLAQKTDSTSVSADDSLDTLEITDSEIRSAEDEVFARADLTQDPFDFETADSEKAEQLPSNFQAWLYQKPKNMQIRFCIDFLIYWMAYGDDRYDPKLKKRIFEAKRLSDNDLIKRWVLQNDIHAFAEAVAWMRKNATQPQLEETILLLMTLLVTEHNITPVQNTLLRFLADVFNMGDESIQEQFELAFGHELPPMPRPDREPWWEKQDEGTIDRWDSRQTAERPEREKLLIRLGLDADHNEADVIQSFRRAAKRCHPDRFPNLSERERAMAEHRFAKFEEARDKLLGVSV